MFFLFENQFFFLSTLSSKHNCACFNENLINHKENENENEKKIL